MATRPTSARSKSLNKNNVTKWINKIKDYQNVSVDNYIKNTLLVAEEFLRRHYKEYVKLSSGATQEDFNREKDHQAKMEEQFREALVIVKSKTDQYEKEQEEERRQYEKQQEEKSTAALIEKDRLMAAAKEQDRREHQQKMQQDRDLIQELINNLKAGLPVSALEKLTDGVSTLVPAFSEFLVPVVFTPFKPFLLREKRVPPTLVIIRRLGFQSPFFTQKKTGSFHRFFFVSFPFFRRQNIKNFKKLNFLLIRACS